jgi:hypothetical protein
VETPAGRKAGIIPSRQQDRVAKSFVSDRLRFARDSLLEENGFKPLVRPETLFRAPNRPPRAAQRRKTDPLFRGGLESPDGPAPSIVILER